MVFSAQPRSERNRAPITITFRDMTAILIVDMPHLQSRMIVIAHCNLPNQFLCFALVIDRVGTVMLPGAVSHYPAIFRYWQHRWEEPSHPCWGGCCCCSQVCSDSIGSQ